METVQQSNKTQAEIDKLVLDNYKFAMKVAHDYKNFGMEFNDVLQEALKGLVIAAEKFDASKNVKFISYAVWWAKAMVMKALGNCNNRVHISISHKYKFTRMNNMTAEWKAMNGDNSEPPVEWLAEKMKCSAQTVENTKSKGQHSVVSVHDYASGSEDGDGTIENSVMGAVFNKACGMKTPEEMMTYSDDLQRLAVVVKRLPKVEQKAIRMKFFEEKTLDEIAKVIGKKTPAGAKSVIDRAVSKLGPMLSV